MKGLASLEALVPSSLEELVLQDMAHLKLSEVMRLRNLSSLTNLSPGIGVAKAEAAVAELGLPPVHDLGPHPTLRSPASRLAY